MISAKLTNCLFLEGKECSSYTGIAYDEDYLYACIQNKSNINKLNLNGYICSYYQTQDSYKSICFDKKETCFWTIKSNYSNYVYKLNRNLKEVDSFFFRDLSRDHIESVSYKTSDDTLILSSPKTIYNVSKQGKLLSKHSFSNNNFVLCSTEINENLIKCTLSFEGSFITINMDYKNYCEENLNCIPAGHRVVSMFPTCYNVRNRNFYVATIKNSQFPYLLRYEIVDIDEEKPCCENMECCKNDQFICINDINLLK